MYVNERPCLLYCNFEDITLFVFFQMSPVPANEPLYAQVNRERKKNRQTVNSNTWEPVNQNVENSFGPRNDSWV